QISVKVGPALATGCAMILKPSEIAPLSGLIVAEVLEAAGVPAGVFNLVNGDGPTVGAALASHPDIDMVSFTGSTRAGIEVAREAAEATKVGDPSSEDTAVGPVVSQAQFEKVQRLIQSAIDEGATIVTGGTGRPEGLDRGYYVKPTVVANVTPDMTIGREEIF